MASDSKISHLRDASFSYLASREENFVLKLTESGRFPHPAISSSHETRISLERKKAAEGEISVFGAEKYFNMKLDVENPSMMESNASKHVLGSGNRVDLHRTRQESRVGTPSVTSVASSYNSQAALLSSSLRNSSQSRQKKVNDQRWFFTAFTCNGSCYDKKSVDTDRNGAKEAYQIARNPTMMERRKQSVQSRFQVKEGFNSPNFQKVNAGSNREDYFVLPTVNSGVQNLKVGAEAQRIREEKPRLSLDVFGSHVMNKDNIEMNLERKLSVLTWDAIPKAQSLQTASTTSQIYEDVESEGSSDLFEIEDLSGSAHPALTKQAFDSMSGCMTPTSRYAPSETSIEWSVVTASAANFSAVTEYDEKSLSENVTTDPSLTSAARNKIQPNGLLGCKSHKAVEVAENVYKRNEKSYATKSHLQQQQHQRSNTSMPARKLKADIKVKDFDFL